MSEVSVSTRKYRPIVLLDRGKEMPNSYCVLVSHSELDNQVGRLMQMCDLIGDVEQRTALKHTIKQIAREWLDDIYRNSGYDPFTGLIDSVKPHRIEE